MEFLFHDESFRFEALRALSYAAYAGADIGEVISTASRIPDGDEAAWYTQWRALAERVEGAAAVSAAAGHTVSAREGYLRASNYYRSAEFYLRDDPDHDPRVHDTGQRAVAAFTRAAALLPQPLTRVAVPYEGTTLPGWWVPADPTVADPRGGPTAAQRPVLLFHGGYDSTGEELYFAGGAAAARRGYHVLMIEGPGQGSALREQHLPFRPDWEVVVTAAVDWLLSRDEVDPDAIALMGMSAGGLLAPRAAAFEHRLAALIAYDGVFSFQPMQAALPAPLQALLAEGTASADDQANAELAEAMKSTTGLRWSVRQGMWAFGVASPVDVYRAYADYDLSGVADLISCPTLVLEGEDDHFVRGQSQALQLRDAITAPTSYHLFRTEDGAGEHCQTGAMSYLHQVVFDWLDETLSATAPRVDAA